MSAQYYHPEMVRFAFVLGIVVSILFYERTQLTTGGIAAPGYLAFAVFDPLILPGVLLAALATHGLIHRALARVVLMPDAAQFSLLILVSAAIHLALDIVVVLTTELGPSAQLLRGIGFIIPGLIAHDFARHGVGRTIASVTGTSALVAAVLLALVVLLPEVGRLRTSPARETVALALAYLPGLILISLIAWLGLARVHGLRCGGFLGGAYLTLLVLQPAELLRFGIAAVVTLLIVRHAIAPAVILFGRRRFAAHMLVGAVLNWTLVRVAELHFAADTLSVVTPSLAVLGVLLTGLLSSDMDHAGVLPTLAGAGLSVAFALPATLLLLEAVTEQRVAVAAPLLAIVVVGGGLMATPPARLHRLAASLQLRKAPQ